MDVKGALKVYHNFKLLQAAPTWGDYPVSCSCKTYFAHLRLCGHPSLPVVSLLKPTVQVPKGYVGALVSERKQCKKVGGLAGRRKRRVLEERRDDEKVIHSKALLLAETPPPAAKAGPSPRDKDAAFIITGAVFPSDDDEDDDFRVTCSFSLWCHCTYSSCGLYRISELSTSDHGRGETVANSS
jgi:hypothetical protein